MGKIILGLFVFGLTIQSFAQEIKIPEIQITPASYKYINKLAEDSTEISPAQPVKLFQQRRAAFNLENSKYYEDEYENYFLSFYIPEGKNLASYDAEGNILRTIEKLKNTEIPPVVAKAVVNKYPGWTVSENIYLINFHDEIQGARKKYKLLLEKGNQRRRVKTDENGNFLKPIAQN